ncbi:hypothetical protein [uncultured Nitratireductor sp.]|uniref:hypothetical protein n=1 Tax=uncultured Nitratireductor sp. TaxID=520953 RepID=UPI0025DE4D35|nr:hypothetical protein [uncultured Nitratireductor sp.]
MRISFSPQRRDTTLELSRAGDVLTINGDPFDFSGVPEGASLPQEAIAGNWFVGPVERVAGQLRMTLVLPHGPNPSPAVAFPEALNVTSDGAIDVPFDPPPPEPEPEIEPETPEDDE